MPALYELLARLLGTKPIRVNLALDAFTFSCGDTTVHLRPLVWLEHAGPTARILAVGYDAPPAGGIAVDLTSSHNAAISLAMRQRALEALLGVGFKKLAGTATFQRPEVVVRNDSILSQGFENEQREALRQAALAAHAVGVRFE